MAWNTVTNRTLIVIDSEKALRHFKTLSKTFKHEIQIHEQQPRIVFCQKVMKNKIEFMPSINHLQQQNLILVVSGDPADSEQVDEKNEEQDSVKITITLYSIESPFNKIRCFQVEQAHFEFATVANYRIKDKTSLLMALATVNNHETAAKLVRLQVNSDSSWTHTIHDVENTIAYPDVLTNTIVLENQVILAYSYGLVLLNEALNKLKSIACWDINDCIDVILNVAENLT